MFVVKQEVKPEPVERPEEKLNQSASADEGEVTAGGGDTGEEGFDTRSEAASSPQGSESNHSLSMSASSMSSAPPSPLSGHSHSCFLQLGLPCV